MDRALVRLLFLPAVLIASSPIAYAARVDPPLVAAAKAGDLAAIRALVQQHADVNVREADGTTPLHWASRETSVEAVRLLLRAGANANAANRYGETPLSQASRHGHDAIVLELLKGGADVKAADAALSDGQTTTMLAARAGAAASVPALAARGADVNAAERRTGTTATMWAAAANQGAALRALIEAGANVNARSRMTQYPHTPPGVIGDALEPGLSYVGQTVLPKGGWTALMYAARQGASDAARVLAEGGADLNAADPDGAAALHLAIINGHYDLVSILLDHGANPNVPDRTGATPLYAAVDMHTLGFGFGQPDLKPSVVAGSVDAIKMLLAHHADPNARLKTPLLKRVYTAGDGKLGEGATPFMRAARAGDSAVMRLLLDAGADPALTQKNGNSPLLLAAGLGSRGVNGGREAGALEAIALCLDRGADINAVNAAGDTAVHIAATTNFSEGGTAPGSPAIIRLLAQRGARLDIKNKRGRTPLEAVLGARERSEEVVALLRQLTGDYTTQVVPDQPAPRRRQAQQDGQEKEKDKEPAIEKEDER